MEQKAELILSGLTDHSFFTTPTPSLTELQTAVEAFDLAIIKAKEGGKTEQLERENKRKELLLILDKLAFYVHFKGGELM